MSKKKCFSMVTTETQRDLIDTLLFIEFGNANISVASYLLELVRDRAKSYLGYPEELQIPDEELLAQVIDKQQSGIKSILGEEVYNKLKSMTPEEFSAETGISIDIEEVKDNE